MFAKNPLIALLIVVKTGDITKIIPKDVRSNPNTGKINIGLVPSSDFGRFLVIFFKNKITYPAKKPPNSPPKNPAPWPAMKPATIPGINAGLSPILIAIYPAKIGIKNPNAAFPPTENKL